MKPRLFLVAVSFFLSPVTCHLSPVSAEPEKVGVLVLAHGGGPSWNAQVEQAVKEADLPLPAEVAFGMGMTPGEVAQIQQAIHRLEASGVDRIWVIPLLVSSHSSVYRQYEYLLGLRPFPSWPEIPVVSPIDKRSQVTMGRGLDDSPLAAEILLTRARGLSKDPAGEAVVLVAHGPEQEEDDRLWLAAMEILGRKVREEGRFAALAVATLRDDAPPPVREEATKKLRSQIADLSRSYRVIVVPLLVAGNGIEEKVRERLSGLSYVYEGKALLPHPNISRWIEEQVKESISFASAPPPTGRQPPLQSPREPSRMESPG